MNKILFILLLITFSKESYSINCTNGLSFLLTKLDTACMDPSSYSENSASLQNKDCLKYKEDDAGINQECEGIDIIQCKLISNKNNCSAYRLGCYSKLGNISKNCEDEKSLSIDSFIYNDSSDIVISTVLKMLSLQGGKTLSNTGDFQNTKEESDYEDPYNNNSIDKNNKSASTFNEGSNQQQKKQAEDSGATKIDDFFSERGVNNNDNNSIFKSVSSTYNKHYNELIKD